MYAVCLPVQSERREWFKRKEFEPGTSPPQTDTDNYAQFNDLPGRNGVQALGIASTQQKQQTAKIKTLKTCLFPPATSMSVSTRTRVTWQPGNSLSCEAGAETNRPSRCAAVLRERLQIIYFF
jgi:hypothetical protein